MMFMWGNTHKLQSTWRDIFGPFQRRGFVLLLLLILSAVIETISLGSIMPLLNTIVQNSENADQARLMGWANGMSQENRLLAVSGVVLVLFLLRSVITLTCNYYAAFFTNSLRQFWSTRIFENFLYSDFLDIKKEKQGHLINAMINEPIYAAKGIHALIDVVVSLFVIFGVGILLLWLNPLATATALLLILGGITALWRVSSVFSENVGKSRVSFNQLINHLIAETVSGIRQVKIFSAESRAWNELNEYIQRLMRMMNRFALVNAAPRAVGEFFVIVLILGALCFGYFVLRKDLSLLLPEISVFALALMKLFTMGSLLLSKKMEVSNYLPSIDLVNRKAAKLPAEKNGDSVVPKILLNRLSVRNLSFVFPDGPPILSNVSFDLIQGQKVGLVGKSGAGKSTLCDILTKLITPTSGDLFVDERPLSSIDRQAWRQRVGYVSQDPFLFNASVKDNIKIGLPTATDDEIYLAAQAAEADKFIRCLPNGYDTLVGAGGVGLSGGQKQRIALARALLRRPAVLVLDEATSGLDVEAESRIFETLRDGFNETIMILVTHRLSSLKWTDTILYLEDGHILESGSFDELYRQNGAFRALMDQGLQEF